MRHDLEVRTDLLKVCFVTGSPEVGRCGIHDYVVALSEALRSLDVVVEVINQRDWSPRGLYQLREQIRRSNCDVVHLQYPMIVGWRSIGPHMAGLLFRTPTIVTLHEFTSFDLLRQMSLRAFIKTTKRIVMTTDYECERFVRAFPSATKYVTTIPIGSNIPYTFRSNASDGPSKVIYFGQIKPEKGLERFVELIQVTSSKQRAWVYQIVGSPVDWAEDYINALRKSVTGCSVEWIINPSNEEAASLLANADVAYLPYPDGVSERRGSLIAALGNGVPVVTTDGEARTESIGAVVRLASNTAQAETTIEALLRAPDLRESLSTAGRAYAAKYDWRLIAERYCCVYNEVSGKRRK